MAKGRAELAAELRMILDECVVTDEYGFYSRWVEVGTDELREILAILEAPEAG